jgi:hypothetical protein
MRFIIIILAIFLFFLGCSKEKEIIPVTPPQIPEQWEKYIGDYQVYDTIGNYMYNMYIKHTSFQQSPQYEPIDTLIIMNFADTFDLRFQYIPNYIDLTLSKEFLNIQVHDSLVDYNGKMWFLSTLGDDSTTEKDENVLKNDTIIFYFKMDNIKFYINEAQPYYYCECKHVAVKQ